MLKMLITNFKLATDLYCVEEYFINVEDQIDKQIGFLYACSKDNLEIVNFLIHIYPQIIFQKDSKQKTGFINACRNNN